MKTKYDNKKGQQMSFTTTGRVLKILTLSAQCSGHKNSILIGSAASYNLTESMVKS